MNWIIVSVGIELPLGEICGRFAQYLIGLLQLAHIALQSLYLFGLLGRDATTLASINFDLLDPFVQRLRRSAKLRGN